MGTPEFMAPEQALGHKLDGRADLYAVGCVGYWLLTGELLYKKPTPMMLLIAHINEPPVSVELRAPTAIPRGLKLCIMDCLAKSPEHRPQDARALLERLQAAEQELPEDERWTEASAQTWWREHRPQPRISAPVNLSPSPASELRIADVNAPGASRP
jgi:serine/threonine-protein kinase